MDVSTELRWFWPNPPRPPERDTFGLLEQTEEERVDRYLVFPTAALGVKLRHGRLELKQRLSARPLAEVGGQLEQWVKWSHAAAAAQQPALEALTETGRWVAVRKRRRSVTLLLRKGELQPGEDEAASGTGCQVELTRVELEAVGRPAGATFWSLGYEAFGAVSRQLQCLLEAHAACTFRPPLGTPNLGDSYSYPEWLLRHSGP